MPRWLLTALSVVVTIGWIVNLIAAVVVKTYKPDPSIDAVFTVMVGGLVGSLQLDKIRNRGENGGPPPGPPPQAPPPAAPAPPDGRAAHELE